MPSPGSPMYATRSGDYYGWFIATGHCTPGGSVMAGLAVETHN